MAISPAAEYPGQIITGLPGYPLGKATNIAVSGDGTGTPFEAKWVSDLFGWEQALLDAAGITLSGNPDEVGASDYMDALDALYPAIGRMTTAESDIAALEASRITGPASATDEAIPIFDGTSGKLVKNGAAKASVAGAISGVTSLAMTGAITGATDVTLSGEVLYSKSRSKSLGTPFQFRPVAPADGWSYDSGADLWVIATNVAIGSGLLCDITPYVRAGMVLTAVKVRVHPGVARAPGGRMFVSMFSGNTLPPTSLSSMGTGVEDDGTTAEQTITFPVTIGATVSASRDYRVIVFKGSNTGASQDRVGGIVLEFTDPGPRNA